MGLNDIATPSRSVSRRDVLRLAGGVAAGGAAAALVPSFVATSGGTATAVAAATCGAVPTNFGRMFPRLGPASWSLADLYLLATATMAEEELEPTPEGQVDDEENLDIDAGLTYIGQFIDHDLTLDARPDDLVTPVDPTTLLNARSPAFDLDSVYGGGPSASPQLYESDGMRLKLGAPLTGSPDRRARDLPRNSAGQALLGDHGTTKTASLLASTPSSCACTTSPSLWSGRSTRRGRRRGSWPRRRSWSVSTTSGPS